MTRWARRLWSSWTWGLRSPRQGEARFVGILVGPGSTVALAARVRNILRPTTPLPSSAVADVRPGSTRRSAGRAIVLTGGCCAAPRCSCCWPPQLLRQGGRGPSKVHQAFGGPSKVHLVCGGPSKVHLAFGGPSMVHLACGGPHQINVPRGDLRSGKTPGAHRLQPPSSVRVIRAWARVSRKHSD